MLSKCGIFQSTKIAWNCKSRKTSAVWLVTQFLKVERVYKLHGAVPKGCIILIKRNNNELGKWNAFNSVHKDTNLKS